MSNNPTAEESKDPKIVNRALVFALILAGFSPVLPAFIWSLGWWRAIFTSCGVLCATALFATLYSVKALRRGKRGAKSYVAISLSVLALAWWVLITVALTQVSQHAE